MQRACKCKLLLLARCSLRGGRDNWTSDAWDWNEYHVYELRMWNTKKIVERSLEERPLIVPDNVAGTVLYEVSIDEVRQIMHPVTYHDDYWPGECIGMRCMVEVASAVADFDQVRTWYREIM